MCTGASNPAGFFLENFQIFHSSLGDATAISVLNHISVSILGEESHSKLLLLKKSTLPKVNGFNIVVPDFKKLKRASWVTLRSCFRRYNLWYNAASSSEEVAAFDAAMVNVFDRMTTFIPHHVKSLNALPEIAMFMQIWMRTEYGKALRLFGNSNLFGLCDKTELGFNPYTGPVVCPNDEVVEVPRSGCFDYSGQVLDFNHPETMFKVVLSFTSSDATIAFMMGSFLLYESTRECKLQHLAITKVKALRDCRFKTMVSQGQAHCSMNLPEITDWVFSTKGADRMCVVDWYFHGLIKDQLILEDVTENPVYFINMLAKKFDAENAVVFYNYIDNFWSSNKDLLTNAVHFVCSTNTASRSKSITSKYNWRRKRFCNDISYMRVLSGYPKLFYTDDKIPPTDLCLKHCEMLKANTNKFTVHYPTPANIPLSSHAIAKELKIKAAESNKIPNKKFFNIVKRSFPLEETNGSTALAKNKAMLDKYKKALLSGKGRAEINGTPGCGLNIEDQIKQSLFRWESAKELVKCNELRRHEILSELDDAKALILRNGDALRKVRENEIKCNLITTKLSRVKNKDGGDEVCAMATENSYSLLASINVEETLSSLEEDIRRLKGGVRFDVSRSMISDAKGFAVSQIKATGYKRSSERHANRRKKHIKRKDRPITRFGHEEKVHSKSPINDFNNVLNPKKEVKDKRCLNYLLGPVGKNTPIDISSELAEKLKVIKVYDDEALKSILSRSQKEVDDIEEELKRATEISLNEHKGSAGTVQESGKIIQLSEEEATKCSQAGETTTSLPEKKKKKKKSAKSAAKKQEMEDKILRKLMKYDADFDF